MTKKIAETRRHFAEIDSTNTYALAWSDAPDGALVVADAQTAGRGRLGRVWSSPTDVGLYFSLILRDLSPEVKSRLSLIVGLAVAEAVQGQAQLTTQIKWPNDILSRGKKIGGILCEATGERIVAGVGLNLNQNRELLPERPLFPASSLLLETDRSFERDTVLEMILRFLETQLDRDWDRQRHDIDQRLFGRGELARAGNVIVLIQGVGDNGALLLRTADGVASITSGEVEFL